MTIPSISCFLFEGWLKIYFPKPDSKNDSLVSVKLFFPSPNLAAHHPSMCIKTSRKRSLVSLQETSLINKLNHCTCPYNQLSHLSKSLNTIINDNRTQLPKPSNNPLSTTMSTPHQQEEVEVNPSIPLILALFNNPQGASPGEQLIEACRRNNTDLLQSLITAAGTPESAAALLNETKTVLGNYCYHEAALRGNCTSPLFPFPTHYYFIKLHTNTLRGNHRHPSRPGPLRMRPAHPTRPRHTLTLPNPVPQHIAPPLIPAQRRVRAGISGYDVRSRQRRQDKK